jgi:hypothetical protein
VGVGVLLFSAVSFAAMMPDQANNDSNAGQGSMQKTATKTRLENTKLKACQARENGIKNRSTQLAGMAKNMQDKFDVIAKRVQDYYTATVIPSGKTVANYDALLADIQAKKAVISSALSKSQADANNFSCTSGDPKGMMTTFKDDMQAVKQALREYRTSIKNLIVAVHAVTGTDK